MTRHFLEQKYNAILQKLQISEIGRKEEIAAIILRELQCFMGKYKRVALYGNGKHTQMLMQEYIFMLKNVEYIIDNFTYKNETRGYKIISEGQLEECGIDAVIISSFVYRKEMIQCLKEKHPQVAYLDIYSKLEERGIHMNASYFAYWHPSNHYAEIDDLYLQMAQSKNKEKEEECWFRLTKKYFVLKDFRSALMCIEQMDALCYNDEYYSIYQDIKELYLFQLQAFSDIGTDNVLMICIDGLRRRDFVEGRLPKIGEYFKKNMLFFTNAYSCSTSTFESLVPAYSENDDLRTCYFKKGEVLEDDCRFVIKAKEQGREIYFYAFDELIKGDGIHYYRGAMTVAEYMWYFMLDAIEEKRGLFYVHLGRESHFPYVNPYTRHLIADSSGILYDYLPRLGGKIRTNYAQQHADALSYIDETIVPFLEKLKIPMVIYADHGNILLNQEEKLEEIEADKFSYHEDLIQIPLAIKTSKMNGEQNDQLISLMSLNEIIICLLNGGQFVAPNREFIKVERSSIYNRDLQYLYQKAGKERELQAFEVFIFQSGYKLVIYENGETKVFLMPENRLVTDEEIIRELLHKVCKYITVCKGETL